MAMPLLRFPDGSTYGWTGSWPPPETLVRATGKLTGGMAMVDPETMPCTMEELEEVCTVERFRRLSYSRLPAEVDAMEHVVRAAEYAADGC